MEYHDEDSAEQQARCRALELAVLMRALADATWAGDEGVQWDSLTKQQRSDLRLSKLRRVEARSWLLRKNPEHRAHVEDIAAAAGMKDGLIWNLVDRFVVNGEDPEPIRRVQNMIAGGNWLEKLLLNGPVCL